MLNYDQYSQEIFHMYTELSMTDEMRHKSY